jgi:thymidylate kinase
MDDHPSTRTLSAPRRTRALSASFSGIDGAGKSTQIERLRQYLTEAGYRVTVISFWDEVATLTKLRETSSHKLFNGDKGVGSPEAPISRKDKNVRSGPMTMVRLMLYTLDAMSLRRVAERALHADADFVIFDRFAYDELANLNLRNPLSRLFTHLLMAAIPRPDVSFFVDADPVAARARKPEYPLEFLRENRRSYLTLFSLIAGVTILPPAPIDDVAAQILKHVRGLTGPAGPQAPQVVEIEAETVKASKD